MNNGELTEIDAGVCIPLYNMIQRPTDILQRTSVGSAERNIEEQTETSEDTPKKQTFESRKPTSQQQDKYPESRKRVNKVPMQTENPNLFAAVHKTPYRGAESPRNRASSHVI